MGSVRNVPAITDPKAKAKAKQKAKIAALYNDRAKKLQGRRRFAPKSSI